jgi:protein-S-isoprenylcysteine O-methyltransferase Ste14
MPNDTIFRIFTLLLLIMMLTISIVYRHRAEQHGGRLSSDTGQRPVLALRLVLLLFALPLLAYLINPDWVAWLRVSLPAWIRWLGVAGGGVSVLLGYWVFHSLGLNVSPTEATREGHQLVTHGPYRWVRHPLYTVGFLFWLFIGLITGLWWIAPGLIAAAVFIVWRIPREEAHLIELFGDEYRQYMAGTGRHFPRLL